MLYYFDSKNPLSAVKMGKLLNTIACKKILPHQNFAQENLLPQ